MQSKVSLLIDFNTIFLGFCNILELGTALSWPRRGKKESSSNHFSESAHHVLRTSF